MSPEIVKSVSKGLMHIIKVVWLSLSERLIKNRNRTAEYLKKEFWDDAERENQ